MRMLIQTQLSNYDTKGKFILECDSGWQMMMGRIRIMLRMVPDLHIDIMGPDTESSGLERKHWQVMTDPVDVSPNLWEKYGPEGEDRLRYIDHRIIPNALVTRYDFNWTSIAVALDLGMQKIGRVPKYDIVYINDPMHLRNFRAMFHIVGGYIPKFVVHSHFIDDPECPKFPMEASLWMGQCEAARKADVNFWQCESALELFLEQLAKEYQPHVVEEVREKSWPWDDGYSSEEILVPPNMSNIRFDVEQFERIVANKVIIFVPNRIGGKGRTSDYTNCGKFMFDYLPEVARRRNRKMDELDYVVFCGNPSQKIFNHELAQWCDYSGYVNLVHGAFNRDEYRYVGRCANIAVGLYNQDSYGGTAARELLELDTLPLWTDCYEYQRIAEEADYRMMVHPNLCNTAEQLDKLIDIVKHRTKMLPVGPEEMIARLKKVSQERCSYEKTTPEALRRMGLRPID